MQWLAPLSILLIQYYPTHISVYFFVGMFVEMGLRKTFHTELAHVPSPPEFGNSVGGGMLVWAVAAAGMYK